MSRFVFSVFSFSVINRRWGCVGGCLDGCFSVFLFLYMYAQFDLCVCESVRGRKTYPLTRSGLRLLYRSCVSCRGKVDRDQVS